jgi:hypothetical protein
MMLSRKRAAELLTEAAGLINGPRAQAYGEPQQSFENIAKHWSTYLGHEITVTDVGMMMILLKVSRHGRDPIRHKRDNLVDICGYASLTGGHLPTDEELKLQVGVQNIKFPPDAMEEIKQKNTEEAIKTNKMFGSVPPMKPAIMDEPEEDLSKYQYKDAARRSTSRIKPGDE